ncbi:PleD family two-component system response regulator [Candidatus Omnitrophota bacterium]
MSIILVVEDNKDNMDLIKEILEDEGYEIFGTESAENGMEILNRGIKVDLILMDVSLPQIDGYEATRMLKKNPRFSDIPIIMLTAHAMEEDKDKGFEAGCDDFLTKPLDEELLLETLKKYTEG